MQTSHAPSNFDSQALSTPGQLSATGLRKSYGGRMVVQDVSISVKSGEVVGLLGPNGA
jgi:lipopolysaccharide export system ATP-binding protein